MTSDGGPSATGSEAADELLGSRKRVSLEALEEAMEYARFALAVYYVQQFNTDDAEGCGRCAWKHV